MSEQSQDPSVGKELCNRLDRFTSGLVSSDEDKLLIAELLDACKTALEQMEALDEVLNQEGHEVAGWHLNGETEPIASFFQDCNEIGAFPKLRAAIKKAEGKS